MRRGLRQRLLCVTLLCGLSHAQVSADAGAVAYGPVPPGLASVIAGESEQSLAAMALGAIRQAEHGTTPSHPLRWARATLMLLGDVGAAAAADVLASGTAQDLARGQLLSVLGASEHPDVDLLLTRAAAEPLPGLRMLAAQGLALGRTPAAVPSLAKLARDPRSGVRAAALRALFAIDTAQARAARLALPEDTEPALGAERLRRHRRTGDATPALLVFAQGAYEHGRDARLRTEAARLLASPRMQAPLETLHQIIQELGAGEDAALEYRTAAGHPLAGYDPVTCRRVAIEAALTLIADEATPKALRAEVIDQAVGWLAQPVAMDAYRRDPIPEDRLRRRLPDFGAHIIEPTRRRVRAGDFYLPEYGFALLRELGPERGRPVLIALLDDPAAESTHARAAYALNQLGTLGSEATARRLLAAPLRSRLRAELIEALRGDAAPWAIPLLGTTLGGTDPVLVDAARTTLQRRPEPAARHLLIEHVFKTGLDVDDHLPPLIRKPDALTWATMKRALADDRRAFRHEARLRLTKRAFRGDEGRAVVAAYPPEPADRGEIEDHIYALLNQDPGAAVAFVRDAWPRLSRRLSALKQLQETWGQVAEAAAVDLALEKADASKEEGLLTSAAAVLKGRVGHREADIERHWRRMLTWQSVISKTATDDMHTCAILHVAYRGCMPLTDLLVPMLDAARERHALSSDTNELNEAARAHQVLGALAVQPWPKVEAAFLRTILDPRTHPEVRVHAARIARGRVRPDAARELVTWLAGEPAAPAQGGDRPLGRKAPTLLQVNVGMAIGQHAVRSKTGGALSAHLVATLQAEHRAFYLVRERLDPVTVRSEGFEQRARALATAIVATREPAGIRALIDLVFDEAYRTYATRSAMLQTKDLWRGGPAAGVTQAATLDQLLHRSEGSLPVLPSDAIALLEALREAPRRVFSEAFGAAIEALRKAGTLAEMPDLFLHRIARALAPGREGRGHLPSNVIEQIARQLPPTRGAVELALGRRRVDAALRTGERATSTQRRVIQIIAQRGYDDGDGLLLERAHARLDMLKGMRLEADGESARAAAAFMRAILRAPADPQTRMAAALAQARSGLDVESALREARRALVLHSRSRYRPTLPMLVWMCEILTRAGHAQEAIDVLEPRLQGKSGRTPGRHFLTLAYAYGGAQVPAGLFELALVRALSTEPGLLDEIRREPAFANTPEGRARLGRIVRRARAMRREDD